MLLESKYKTVRKKERQGMKEEGGRIKSSYRVSWKRRASATLAPEHYLLSRNKPHQGQQQIALGNNRLCTATRWKLSQVTNGAQLRLSTARTDWKASWSLVVLKPKEAFGTRTLSARTK